MIGAAFFKYSYMYLEIARSELGFKPIVLPPCDAKESFKVLDKLLAFAY